MDGSVTLPGLGPAAAIAAALALFLFLLFLFKIRIGSATILILLAAIVGGLTINHWHAVHSFLSPPTTFSTSEIETKEEDFHAQMLSAIEELKNEVMAEKESLQRVMSQMHEVFDALETQKQKLQIFIDEVRDQFEQNPPSQEHQ